MPQSNKLKLLIITRLFSGLKDSVDTRQWQPKGIPTIYKLIEGLDCKEDVDLDVIFACKSERESKNIDQITSFKFDKLEANIYLLPFKAPSIIIGKKRKSILFLLNQTFHFLYILWLILKNDYDLIYAERMHVGIAGFCASVLRKKVVLRLLGVYRSMKKLVDSKNKGLRTWFVKKAYRSPFEYVVCTQDGSGGEYFIGNMIRPNTSHEILLNGVRRPASQKINTEAIKQQYNLSDGKKVILFVGKLEAHKGCIEFTRTIIALSRMNDEFYAFLVGDGPLREQLQQEVADANLQDRVFFTGLIEHALVANYFELADIYVSLNLEGSLSNTVLEAITFSNCIIRLSSSSTEHIDLYTDALLSDDYAVIVDRNNIERDLPTLLLDLLNNPARIDRYSNKTKELAERILWSWDERVNHEIDLLYRLAKQ